jgi:nitroimidazol reductase NimA-like FMN-containing flavoprotein (pyridoxamine 5'-phosphate oxidase superfamily)
MTKNSRLRYWTAEKRNGMIKRGITKREREVTDLGEILEILDKSMVAHIGMVDGDEPYVVPMNYGYTMEDGKLTVYLHGALWGRKLDIIRKNNKVGFELDCDHALKTGSAPCAYGYYYSSIVGNGVVTILEEPAEKAAGLNILMEHQAGKPVPVPEKATAIVSVFRMDVTNYSARQNRPAPIHSH